MADRHTAVAALREQLAGETGGSAGILGPEAVRAAEALRAATTDTENDSEVAYVLGYYHWMRYESLPEGQDLEDLARAVRYLRRQEGHGELADRLDQLRSRLDTLDQPRSTPFADSATSTARTASQMGNENRLLADQRRTTHAEWDSLLTQIRALPGFTDFLRTPSIGTLARHAHDGPIVYVTANHTRADALILTNTPIPVHLVPLPNLTEQSAHAYADRLRAAYQPADVRDVHPIAPQDSQRDILDILEWLWDAIAAPVHTGP